MSSDDDALSLPPSRLSSAGPPCRVRLGVFRESVVFENHHVGSLDARRSHGEHPGRGRGGGEMGSEKYWIPCDPNMIDVFGLEPSSTRDTPHSERRAETQDLPCLSPPAACLSLSPPADPSLSPSLGVTRTPTESLSNDPDNAFCTTSFK